MAKSDTSAPRYRVPLHDGRHQQLVNGNGRDGVRQAARLFDRTARNDVKTRF